MIDPRRLLSELKRRRVFRATAVYLVVAWVVIEVGDVVVPALGLPDWLLTAVVVLALLGLPLAFVLSWAFDVTAEGVQKTADVTHDEASPVLAPPPASGARRIAAWASFAVLAAVVAGWFLLGPARDADPLDPDAVAVLPFRVSGASPSVSFLREGMVDLLAAKLTGEPGLRAVDPRTVLYAWRRRTADETVPAGQALEIAQDVGAGKVVLGEVVGGGAQFAIAASLLDATDGRVLARATRNGTEEELLAMVDGLAAEILALEAGEATHRLEQVTSRSLPAVRAYLEGQASYRSGRYLSAVDRFGEALDADSTFALAGLSLWEAAQWTPSGVPGTRRGIEIAWRHRERLPPRDVPRLRLLAMGAGYPARAPRVEMLVVAEEARALAPDRPEAVLWYGDVLFHFGRLLGIDDALDRAEEALAAAHRLDPSFIAGVDHRFQLAVYRGDTVAVRRHAERFLSLGGENETAPAIRFYQALALGDSAALASEVAAFDSLTLEQLAKIVTWTPWVGVGTAESELAWRRLLRDAGMRRREAGRRVGALYEYGRPAAARAFAQEAGLETAPHPVLAALYLQGDTSVAARVVRNGRRAAEAALEGVRDAAVLDRACLAEWWRLTRGSGRPTPGLADALLFAAEAETDAAAAATIGLCAHLLAAMSAVVEGRQEAPERVAALDAFLRTGPPAPDDVLLSANLASVRLNEAIGELEAAHAAARRRYHQWSRGFLAAQLREEGRIAAALGDRDGAARAYRHYLALRHEPEPAVQAEVDAVRRELAVLGGPG